MELSSYTMIEEKDFTQPICLVAAWYLQATLNVPNVIDSNCLKEGGKSKDFFGQNSTSKSHSQY